MGVTNTSAIADSAAMRELASAECLAQLSDPDFMTVWAALRQGVARRVRSSEQYERASREYRRRLDKWSLCSERARHGYPAGP